MERWSIALFLTAACFGAAPVLSNPVNPTVVSGTATFNHTSPVLTVTNSNGTVINWDKFNISAGDVTRFVQTSASSAVLNRVRNDPTVIYGNLSSNGRVFLLNPVGIFVGPGGSRVNTAGFVASRLLPPLAPVAASAPAASSMPPRSPPPATAPANTIRMVDGAVTLRVSLVDASPIALR